MLRLFCLLLLFAIACSEIPSYAEQILTRATAVKGVVRCGKTPAKGVHVRLYRNTTENRDDIIDAVVTGDDGSYSLEGNTAGRPKNETGIEPTVRFYHKCDLDEKKNEYRKFAMYYNHSFVTLGRIARRPFDAGILNLELIFPKEQKEKKFEPLKAPIYN